MIEKLRIRNFKSIKELNLDCRRINIFIGEPNTGKSNILESLGLLSWTAHGGNLGEYVRLRSTSNLFYDEVLDNPVQIEMTPAQTGSHKMQLALLKIIFQDGFFRIEEHSHQVIRFGHSPEGGPSMFLPQLGFIKYFKFINQPGFGDPHAQFLLPPSGRNLFSVVYAHSNLRAEMSSFFENFGTRLVLKPQQQTFELQKQVGNLVFSYPYELASETLQRIIFHTIAIASNVDSTLIFEEPESHAFPYYTKFLGEKIAFDDKNQYFIATHNPYILLSILEKAPKGSVNVFITYFKDYETKAKPLSDTEISELMKYDPFFNLHSFIEEEVKE